MVTSISTAFYDSLFGSHSGCTSINSLEVQTLNNVREQLNAPKKMRECIPSLPTILLDLIVIPKAPSLAI